MSETTELEVLLTEVAVNGGSALWIKAPDGRWHNQGADISYETANDLTDHHGQAQFASLVLTDRFTE